MTATEASPSARERLLAPGSGPLSVDDWFALPETADQYELYEGMLVMVPPPGGGHQSIQTRLLAALMRFADGHGGFAWVSPTGVVFEARIGFLPDVLYLSPQRMNLYSERGLEGPPDIAVEILSPSTRRYDLNVKLPVYLEKVPGETWYIDPEAKTVTVYRKDEEPQTVAFGEVIPSRIVDVGTAGLDRLPPLFD